ncbi:hypothetical protein BGX38DRAFT_1138610 [Terfezia claveryi]|nr:hypothetical protein BGX38DRAFT_1138610 [Terfezia claveryi]
MPIVLDDSILIPPSLRRGPPPRVYNIVQPGTTTTTIIEPGASHIPHRPLTPPRSPVFIHQETTSYIPPQDDLGEFRGEVESHSIDAPHEGGFEVSRPRHYYDDDFEDDRRHGSHTAGVEHSHRHHGPHVIPGFHGHEDYPGPHESERHHRRVRHLAQAGLAAGALGAAKEIHDRGRRRVEDRSPSDSSDGGHGHHKGRKIAAAALGATAAGAAAAHHMYKRRQRSRARSSDSYYSSPSDTDHHPGRKVAGAALGATAASIAAHKIHQHRQKSKSSSGRSRSSSSGREHPHHRKAKLAAAAIGTGLAARHLHHRRKARSKPPSRSPSREREPWGRHLAAAALGATAAGLAHHEYNHHQAERPRPVLRRSYSDEGLRGHRNHIFSRNRSPSPHKHSKLKKAAATAVAAAVAKKAIDHYREGRSRSRSSDRSPERHRGLFHRNHSRPRSRSKSRHRIGIPEAAATLIGAGIAGERAHKKHKEKKREQEMHGRGVAVPTGDPQHMHHGSSSPYAHPGGSLNGGGYAETIDSDTTTTTIPRDNTPPPQDRNRSRRASLDASSVDGFMNRHAEAPHQRRTLGDGLSPEAIAYKLGQTIGRNI